MFILMDQCLLLMVEPKWGKVFTQKWYRLVDKEKKIPATQKLFILDSK